MTMETVFGQMLALWLGNGDEHHALESDMTGLNVKGNLYLYLTFRLFHLFFSCVLPALVVQKKIRIEKKEGSGRSHKNDPRKQSQSNKESNVL